jgi:predicted negative regulator of RcsB-dependent stress response
MAQRHTTSGRRKPGDHGHDGDDIFVAKVVEYSTWARKNTQTLVLVGIVLAVIVGGLVYWTTSRESRQVQAIQQLENIQASATLGDPATAKAELTGFIERFDGTAQALEARIALAELQLRTDQPREAVSILSDAGLSVRDPMGPELYSLLARAHEAAGQMEQAEATFMNVAERAPLSFQRSQALADAARIRIAQGDAAGAVELYDRILDGLEDTDPLRGRYEMLRAEARARSRDT